MKPHLSISGQVQKLIDRNLVVDEPELLEKTLLDTNYYRLSGYLRPFQISPGKGGDDNFKPGTTFEEVFRTYELDTQLRAALWNLIAPIEVVVRARFAYYVSCRLGPDGYAAEKNYKSADVFSQVIGPIDDDINQSKEVFIKHHNESYQGEEIPVWAAFEVVSFGNLIRALNGLKSADIRRDLAAGLNLHPDFLTGALKHLSYVRNICAHHARLWNRTPTVKMPHLTAVNHPLYKRFQKTNLASTAQTLMLVTYLHKRIYPNLSSSGELIETLTPYEDLSFSMGFVSAEVIKELECA